MEEGGLNHVAWHWTNEDWTQNYDPYKIMVIPLHLSPYDIVSSPVATYTQGSPVQGRI